MAEAGGRQQWVALECALNPGSTPKPIIEWVQRDGGAGGTETVLVEDFTANSFRFIDDGQWLILETTSDAVTGKEYFCRVTNKERFQTARGPTTYTLNAGECNLLLQVQASCIYCRVYLRIEWKLCSLLNSLPG